MRKVLKIIKTRWLSVIAFLILLIAILGTLNYYLKDTVMIIDHKMTDVRGVFFEMLMYQSWHLIFLVPLSVMLLIIDEWHNKFKNGNIKNYLTRMSYQELKKKLFFSSLKTALIYPLVLFIFLLISVILAKGGNDISSMIEYGGYYDASTYHQFPWFIVKTTILLYIQGVLVSFYSLLFLNKTKNKILLILFTYITWIISLVALHVIPYMFLDLYFNCKIDATYLTFYLFLLYNDPKVNFPLYLLALSTVTFLLFAINYFFIYRNKEKVVINNEKEMV